MWYKKKSVSRPSASLTYDVIWYMKTHIKPEKCRFRTTASLRIWGKKVHWLWPDHMKRLWNKHSISLKIWPFLSPSINEGGWNRVKHMSKISLIHIYWRLRLLRPGRHCCIILKRLPTLLFFLCCKAPDAPRIQLKSHWILFTGFQDMQDNVKMLSPAHTDYISEKHHIMG